MNRYESLAKYFEILLGNDYDIKYYSNKSIDWEKIIIADENMVHGSIKVIGGQNQSIKGVRSTIEEMALTMMIPFESYSEVVEYINGAFEGIDKQMLLLGENYYQFVLNYHSDLEQYTFNANKYYGVTYNFSITSFDDLFLGDNQTVKITISNEDVALLGLLGVTFKMQSAFDGSVGTSGIQRNYIAGINQDLVIDGLVVKDDVARKYVKDNRKNKLDFVVAYFDGESTITETYKLGAYTCNGIVGNLMKYQITFIQKG